jgi:hypothetical protein
MRYKVTLALVAVLTNCISDSYITENEFVARTDEEREAKERIRYWVDAAETLLDDPNTPDESKERLREAIANTRATLSAYNNLRNRGAQRAMIIAPIQTSAGAIVADDATGVGMANDILLIPVALAAIATYLVTDAPPSQRELTWAWNRTLTSAGTLGTTVEDVVLFLAAPGNVVDTAIMEEAQALITAGKAESICAALQMLMNRTEDSARRQRIKRTQKAKGCRHSRHS